MRKGDHIVLCDGVIAVGSFGSEYLLKGTEGVFIEENGPVSEISIRGELFTIPTVSIRPLEEKAA